ncbi:hypothetical protein P43SY_003212 [Pythium insidiosum]|uniref:Uncharacterized protein n=1 Tax=Pythium insidiosum TaxID=114742 RepID=A0AAD5M6Y8_PYTIN|nr:hypothetical protein P43SY_003212 [Pythium insidiosum]
MSRPRSEETASHEFLEALLDRVRDDANRKDVEYLVEHVFPVLIPAIVHLLKTRAENERRLEDEDPSAVPLNPMNHLARYLFRHNPRHHEPTTQIAELHDFARTLLRK